MANLPIELWHSIFDFLELVDISACARVSKAVYLAVKAYRIREIAFTRRVYKWFHYTTPIIHHKHRVDFTMASMLKRSSFDFDHLKRLKIGRRSAIDLDVINQFIHLEELDIDLKNYENEKSRTLSLPNLKVLYIFVPDHLPYVKLDTPRLAKLNTFSLKTLEFVYPESVQCIHTFIHDGKLSMFCNLEYLNITNYYNQNDFFSSYASREFEQFSWIALEKLKAIDFNYHPDNGVIIIGNFRGTISNLLTLDRPDLKVFWQNVQVTDPTLLTEYERSIGNFKSLLAFQLQHYEHLKKKIDCFWNYEFNGSMTKLSRAGFNLRSEKFISKLIARYSFRRIVIIGQVEEREILLELIARSSNLLSLEFEKSARDQSFFDRIADTIQLNDIPLEIFVIRKSTIGVLNFEFVLRFRDLMWFGTDQQLPAKLIEKLFEMPMLAEIEFPFGQSFNRIGRVSASRFFWNGKSVSRQVLFEHFGIKSGSIQCGLM